jgi:GDP-L-fucose synthase
MSKLLVAGATGLAGRGIVRVAKANGFSEIIEISSKTCDLTNPVAIRELVNDTKPDLVIDAAAKVGGIFANSTCPVEFLETNILIQTNLFKACHEAGVERVVFLSSSCVYPKNSEQPIKESSLMTGVLEETNSAYAIAKISGMKLIQAYRQQYGHHWISVMPTNLFGIHDNFSINGSHVLPALIRKFHDAHSKNSSHVTLWGTGSPRRELMEVEDFARALFLVIEKFDKDETINIGTGVDYSIQEIAKLVNEVVGFQGRINWDGSKPDGVNSRLLDVSKLKNLGFEMGFDLKSGITKTYNWFKSEISLPGNEIRL